ncbi:MAG: DUF4139 domain-containing protein [Armatimonadota bacterium]|nr:DUF4139 domain-containing protein [Armatimonadota bacterium]
MVLTAFIVGAALAPAPLQLAVSSASLFKNGYAVVVREAPLRGNGEYVIEDMPQAVLGTMWITATPGTKISSVIVTNQETTTENPAQTLDEILRANVGRVLRLHAGGQVLHGKLLSADGQVLVIQEAEGTRVIIKQNVHEIAADGDIIWKTKATSVKPVMKLNLTAAQNAKLYVVSLERGLTWMPGYSIDISNERKLELISKATILNDLADLPGIEVRLITGFPNVPFIGYWDPLTSKQSVDQFVNGLMQMGTPDQMRDRGIGFANQMSAPAGAGGFDEAFNISPLPGLSAEDLFFYRLPKIEMKKGDRGYFILLAMESDYSHVYEWDIPDKVNSGRYAQEVEKPGDVWHSLKFKNNSKQPLTTGPATIFKDGEILGQDSLLYTSIGADALVKMSKALDVRAEDYEEEIERQVLEQPVRGSWYDVVTLRGTLSVLNRKSETVDLKITKEITGELVTAEGTPKTRTITRGLRAVNPRQRLEWSVPLKAGEGKTITYTYKVHLLR